MDYDEAMAFLTETKKYGSRPGLTTIRALMRELGDVQERVPVVHIGGTNGKGSVGAMLSAALTEAGYKVGWFNTPEVFSYEEEFRVNGVPIAKDRLAEIFTEVQEACGPLRAESLPDVVSSGGASSSEAHGDVAPLHPTRFEVETAAAFLWFYRERCDLALIEVGMGGALDATNLITKPLVSVLTSVGRDHTRFLGDTLREIATAKAGIVKLGCPVVTAPQEPEVTRVIRARCDELQAPLYVVNSDSAARLFPPFMEENASCAVKTLEVLRARYPDRFSRLTDETIASGLGKTDWPGRYERLRLPGADGSDGPLLILDGAHNPPAARRLREALDADYPNQNFRYLMGVLADKDYESMARILFRPGDRVLTVTPPNPRGLPASTLAAVLRAQKIAAHPCETVRDAVSYIKREAKSEDVIVALGSLSYLGALKQAL